MQVYCGIDWAENQHDVALVDEHGMVAAKQRISDDAAGFAQLLALLAEHGDSPAGLVPVAIETSRGLLVAGLRGTGRSLYVINPLAASRYRDRYSVARKKSDHADAVVLANILRTDAHAHRPLPADGELVQAIAVLARAQQDAVWNRAWPQRRGRRISPCHLTIERGLIDGGTNNTQLARRRSWPGSRGDLETRLYFDHCTVRLSLRANHATPPTVDEPGRAPSSPPTRRAEDQPSTPAPQVDATRHVRF